MARQFQVSLAALSILSAAFAHAPTVHAADTAFSPAKIVGLRVATNGDLTVYPSDRSCAVSNRDIIVKASLPGYAAMADALTAAYLSGATVALRTDDATCAVVALRIGDM